MTTIHHDFCDTPFGEVLIARSQAGICHLEFTADDRAAALGELAARWPDRALVPADLAGLAAALFARPAVARPALELAGTPFQRRVWTALLEVPAGSTVAYSELARRIGQPRAARAVGRAVGSNRLAVLVPCHRVVTSAGETGRYRWGGSRKAALLAWEGAAAA